MKVSKIISSAFFFMMLAGCSSVDTKMETASIETQSKVPGAITVTPVTLASSNIFTLYSKQQDENYRIRVRVPDSYSTNTDKTYPVIIKVDGQWDFLLATSAYDCIYFDGQMPESILIGIDWPETTENIHAIRSRDLLPGPVPYFQESGKAKSFVDVLQKDLIPALEQRYRLNGQRYLLGGSWGAVFTSYALLERPELFTGAIAIGGEYDEFKPVFDALIKQRASSTALKGKRLYLGVGQYDEVAPSNLKLAQSLENARIPGLEIKLDHLQGFGHSGMNIPGYAAGYQFLFKRPTVALSQQKLASYTGTYQSTDTENPEKLWLSIEDNHLVTLCEDNIKLTHLAAGSNQFYLPGAFHNLNFNGDTLTVETFFGTQTYQRIN